jgi:hypothetical protein
MHALPDLLGRGPRPLMEASAADCAVIYVQLPGGDVHVVATAGWEEEAGRALARASTNGSPYGRGTIAIEPLGRDADGPRFGLIASPRPIGHPVLRRLRMIAAVARQGFALCAARDRPVAVAGLAVNPPSLEPLLPGFLSASAAMTRVVEQIQRLQGNDLTVLITGESGTGKELVSRAIHVGSHRSAGTFLPYNCTTTGRDLADSQLFGHRRGSFTGAVTDQPGLIRTASGGTLFLDEIGDLPLDVQPKLLRQGGTGSHRSTRPPQRVDVRVIAATNADLNNASPRKFREDLLPPERDRIHVPPTRERRRSHWRVLSAQRSSASASRISTCRKRRCLLTCWWPGNAPAEKRIGGPWRSARPAARSIKSTCRRRSAPQAATGSVDSAFRSSPGHGRGTGRPI